MIKGHENVDSLYNVAFSSPVVFSGSECPEYLYLESPSMLVFFGDAKIWSPYA